MGDVPSWPVAITPVPRPSSADVVALRSLDASFGTDVVLAVSALPGGGFALSEERVDPPVTRRYRFADGLRAGERPPWDTLFVARAGADVLGVAATTFTGWNRRQRVDELHVAPGARGRGLARELLDRVRDVAVANGARELWLETQTVNLPAVRAYRRMGFAVTGIDTTRYAPPFDADVALFLSAPVTRPPT